MTLGWCAEHQQRGAHAAPAGPRSRLLKAFQSEDNNIKLDNWPCGSFADLLTEVYEKKASTLRVINGELIRHLRVIKVWLVTEILGVTHLLVTKSKDRPICMSLEKGMTWEQALDQALSIRLGLEARHKAEKTLFGGELQKEEHHCGWELSAATQTHSLCRG